MDVKAIRTDFPVLNKKINDLPIIYFDNACQTLRPYSVIEAVRKYYVEYSACAGRSNHKLGARVTQLVEESRHLIAKFINAHEEQEIIFTRNTTEGINLISNTLDLGPGDEVIISDKEHNSNLIPWLKLVKNRKIKVKVIPSNSDNTFNLEAFKKSISSQTRLVSVVMTSNLDGVSNPISEIIKIAHKNKVLVLLDGAQFVPHSKVDVRKLDVDFLAFSGHKMLGPSGIGILYGKKKLLEELDSFMVGGDTVSNSTYTSYELLPLPERFEAGLQNYAGIIGLAEAVKYLEKVGFEEIQKQELKLNRTLTEGLKGIKGLHLIGPEDPSLRGGIYSFYIDNWSPHQVSLFLDQTENIALRAGQHCVHSWFNNHHLKGSIRASFYFYNTLEEVEILVKALKQLLGVR